MAENIVGRPTVAKRVAFTRGVDGACLTLDATEAVRVAATARRWLIAGRLSVSDISFFFAGGGTGGHIYPALAVAEEILAQDREAEIRFLCSTRAIDRRILDKTGFVYTPLPATGLYLRPDLLVRFGVTFWRSYVQARQILEDRLHPHYGQSRRVVVIGAGGFVAAPVCLAGRRLGVPVALVNVDIVAGRANRLCARWADEVFVQFEDSRDSFKSVAAPVHVVGCPLRRAFAQPDRAAAIKQSQLDPRKKVLLVTGASSGSASINEAVTRLLPKLEAFADAWQIVHLTGLDNHVMVARAYEKAQIAHQIVNYYDRMPDLYAAADLLIGRSGAVSVAEYAMAGVPSICMPYPHNKDRHQYLNAGKLVEVGAAVIVDDVADANDRIEWLWEELEPLLKDDAARRHMAGACRQVARPNAAAEIARRLLAMSEPCAVGLAQA
jgi:UDP-N-acetylglucosamine--N-acetylmuramyl-(pentapeptide) pyrophosphoryl-undecaprenol N-acetylglucosamine transferase